MRKKELTFEDWERLFFLGFKGILIFISLTGTGIILAILALVVFLFTHTDGTAILPELPGK